MTYTLELDLTNEARKTQLKKLEHYIETAEQQDLHTLYWGAEEAIGLGEQNIALKLIAEYQRRGLRYYGCTQQQGHDSVTHVWIVDLEALGIDSSINYGVVGINKLDVDKVRRIYDFTWVHPYGTFEEGLETPGFRSKAFYTSPICSYAHGGLVAVRQIVSNEVTYFEGEEE